MESWPYSLQVGDLTSLASVSLSVKWAHDIDQGPTDASHTCIERLTTGLGQ